MWIWTDDGRYIDLPTKLGTQICMEDGREATVVFNGLCGVGIKWGLYDPPAEDFEGTAGDLFGPEMPPDWPWEPDAFLREPWDGCERAGFTPEECVGYRFTVIGEEQSEDQTQ